MMDCRFDNLSHCPGYTELRILFKNGSKFGVGNYEQITHHQMSSRLVYKR